MTDTTTRRTRQYQTEVAEEVKEEVVEASPSPVKRSRARKIAFENVEPTSTERRSARGRRESLDAEINSGHGRFHCYDPDCGWISDSRATRSFHMRREHPNFKYSELDAGSQSVQAVQYKNTPHTVRTRTVNASTANCSQQLGYEHASPQVMDDIVDDFEEDEEESEFDPDEPSYIPSEEEEDLVMEDKPAKDRKQEEPAVDASSVIQKRPRGRPRKPPGQEPGPRSRLRIGNAEGRYACYVEGCRWKGLYRSIRSAHMRAMHKDWVRPPRFVLNRISRHGEVLPAGPTPRFSCLVEGCPWRGNYRASRSAHMRNAHKEIHMPKRRAQPGGYVENGRYPCHIPDCDWRGASRSTRSQHIRREHDNFVNTVYSARNVPCSDCPASLMSHKLFVDHMVCEHNVGGIVQREFADPRDYEEWFDAVQDSFSIDFIKRMGVKQTAQYQVLYLYCARGGGYRDPRMHRYNRNALNPIRNESKKRSGRMSIGKCGKNCAAFLRVLNWVDGRLTVIGCVEHTGHRMGTPLLRLGQMEREVMDEYLYVMDTATPLELVLDRLRESEGLVMDGFEVAERTAEYVKQFVKINDSEVDSLRELLKMDRFKNAVFHVNLPLDQFGQGFTLGIMTAKMQELWRKFSTKATCIEEVRLVLNNCYLRIFLVLVFDQNEIPRCCAVYLTHSQDRQPLFDRLYQVYNVPPETMVTDCSPEYDDLSQATWGNASFHMEHQLAEWHLLSEWAAVCDQLVGNRVDRFSIICALRRWIRASDQLLFETLMQELFEALREMELDELATFLDSQVTEPHFAKRWSPLARRNPLTDHNNPMLEISCRMLREKYLSCELCKRIDEYIGLVLDRIHEFNSSQVGAVYSLHSAEPARPIPLQDWHDDHHDMRYISVNEAGVILERMKDVKNDDIVHEIEYIEEGEVEGEEDEELIVEGREEEIVEGREKEIVEGREEEIVEGREEEIVEGREDEVVEGREEEIEGRPLPLLSTFTSHVEREGRVANIDMKGTEEREVVNVELGVVEEVVEDGGISPPISSALPSSLPRN